MAATNTKKRLYDKPIRFRTDGTQLSPGWYKVNDNLRHRSVDNRVTGAMRYCGPRTADPPPCATSGNKMRDIGPGCYKVGGMVPDITVGCAKILKGNRWIKSGHMVETEAARNPQLAPAKYCSDQYFEYSQTRLEHQGNRSGNRCRAEAVAAEEAGLNNGGAGGSLLLTSYQRHEGELNANRLPLDTMGAFWKRGGVKISSCPRFNWQRGPQSHTLLHKRRPATAAATSKSKPATSVGGDSRPATAAERVRKPTNTRPKAPFVLRAAPSISEPRAALSPAFKQSPSKQKEWYLQKKPVTGAADCRGNPWSFFESEIVGKFDEN